MPLAFIIRNILLLFSLVFIGYLFMKKEQDSQLNWAMFFSFLWVFLLLLLVNWFGVYLDFWHFNDDEDLSIFIPYDLYFVWGVFWGILMPFLLRGKFIFIAALSLFFLDIIGMPILAEYGLLSLNKNWIWGELLLILVVYLPAHLWVYLFLEKRGLKWRSLFQFLCMSVIYAVGLPLMVYLYFPNDIYISEGINPFILQLAFIILLPGLIAVIDLAEKGNGTPFPYDPTTNLVETGVYAYIRNPIQWSLTFFFIPLALFFHSYYLLLGILVSISYTIGVSEPQEKASMRERFPEQWEKYKKKVPLWYFLWRPVSIPKATIYFKKNCDSCSETRAWFERRKPIHLIFEDAETAETKSLLQVSYQADNGQLYTSIMAISYALEHINLAWASLAWFIRLPGIRHLLQLIINSMGLMDTPEECDNGTK